jgi:hypothetical protein
MNTLGAKALTQRQTRFMQAPPEGYTVIGARGHRLLVRRPDGRQMRVRPSGRLVEAGRVKSVQSYLYIPAA